MDEGQKKSLIGRGMKPRGNKAVKPQKEKKSMTEQSTTEGQQTDPKEAVLEPQEGNETPGNLEPENGENLLQNLEKSEATIARDDAPICPSCGQAFTWNEGLQSFEHDNPCSGADLEAALNESQEWPTHCAHGKPINEVCEKCKAADMGQVALLRGATDPSRNLQPLVVPKGSIDLRAFEAAQSAYGSVKFTEEPGEAWITKDGIKEILKRYRLGDQPDGSCGFIVKVQEGYVDAVKQWAEADGVEVERWLSDRLYEYISTYGEPAKGR
jgi:hypothetical protein